MKVKGLLKFDEEWSGPGRSLRIGVSWSLVRGEEGLSVS